MNKHIRILTDTVDGRYVMWGHATVVSNNNYRSLRDCWKMHYRRWVSSRRDRSGARTLHLIQLLVSRCIIYIVIQRFLLLNYCLLSGGVPFVNIHIYFLKMIMWRASRASEPLASWSNLHLDNVVWVYVSIQIIPLMVSLTYVSHSNR